MARSACLSESEHLREEEETVSAFQRRVPVPNARLNLRRRPQNLFCACFSCTNKDRARTWAAQSIFASGTSCKFMPYGQGTRTGGLRPEMVPRAAVPRRDINSERRSLSFLLCLREGMPFFADGSVDAVTKPVDAVTGTVVADFERRSLSFAQNVTSLPRSLES